jgi:Fe-S-cluster-containing dehydrogenase component
MAYMITSQCIECHRCESTCPTGAITQNGHQSQINFERCNDCVGHYSVPQCWAACPTNSGCIPLRSTSLAVRSSDYWDTWFDTYNHLVSRLNAKRQSDYWPRWFDTYSQALAIQLHPSSPVGVNA